MNEPRSRIRRLQQSCSTLSNYIGMLITAHEYFDATVPIDSLLAVHLAVFATSQVLGLIEGLLKWMETW